MTGADVNLHIPLIRLNPWYPGQMGVEGAWTDTGLRTHSTGTVFYVSPNHPGASDLRDGTDPNDPLVTVQAAINRCESYRGDVIAVMPHGRWAYSPGTIYPLGISESALLDKHGVHLMGLSSATIGVPWYTPLAGGTALTVTGIDCIVEGFAFCGFVGVGAPGRAIYATWILGGPAYGENLTILNNVFSGPTIGLQLEFNWYCHIHNNTFWALTNYGLYFDRTTTPANAPEYCEINDNIFHNVGANGGGGAIRLPGCNYCYIHHNQCYNDDAQAAAAATDEGFVTNDGTLAGLHNTVALNVFSCQNTKVAAGDFGDLNGGSATDCWTENYCMNAVAYGIP